MYTPSFLFMKKILLCLSISVLFLTACNKVEDDLANQPQDNQIIPLVNEIIPNAVTDYDGNSYDAVRIGEQVWMASNLRTTHYANGEEIPEYDLSNHSSANYIISCDDVAHYGYLYSWPAVMHYSSSSEANPSEVQGICPNGWHVPSNAEWNQLFTYVGTFSEYVCSENSENVAKALAANHDWEDASMWDECAIGNNLSANNATNFNILAAGRGDGDHVIYLGIAASFWTCTAKSCQASYDKQFFYDQPAVVHYANQTHVHCSVRCVRD
jgi:uncharacterized protein (TIGR02145 family)